MKKRILIILIMCLMCISSTSTIFASSINTSSTVSAVAATTKVAAPRISNISVEKEGQVTIKWNKVNKAVKYRVFRKTSSTSWKKLVDTTNLSYVDRTAKNGIKYTYAVRCIDKSGKTYTSALSSSINIMPVSTPKISKLSNTSSGVQISWNKINKAEMYRVYRKVSKGTWTKLTDTASTSFIDKTAKSGETYMYTVRCISKDKKYFTSAYNTVGKAIKRPVTETKITANTKDVHAKFIGLPGKEKKQIKLLDTEAFYKNLQNIIDAGNIACYPNNDMTKGVKYLAGHNPGSMSHINTIKIGSIVRLYNTKGEYQDYKVVEHTVPTANSFVDVVFKTSKSDAWTMMNRFTENSLIIQFCVGGKNNFWYCKAV